MNRDEILKLSPEKLNFELHKRLFDPTVEFGQTIPAYSADISAAWKVVEKMRDLGWSTKIYHGSNIIKETFVKMRHIGDTSGAELQTTEANCKTAPEAICKAAILAIGEG